MIERLNKTFGDDSIHIIGNWNDSNHTAKLQQSTITVGLRRILQDAGLRWYLIDEFKTSSICPFFNSSLEGNDKERLSASPQRAATGRLRKIHGENVCDNGNCFARYQNRDKVATRNMWRTTMSWLVNGRCLRELARTDGSDRLIPVLTKTYKVHRIPDNQERVYYLRCPNLW